MSRSLKVKIEYIHQVKSAVKRNGYPRQKDLAEDIGLALATVSNFLNGKPVDHLNFLEICERLGQDWKLIARIDADIELEGESTNTHKLSSQFVCSPEPDAEADSPTDNLGIAWEVNENRLLELLADRIVRNLVIDGGEF